MEFIKALESLLNTYSKENGSNTPDFILANYLKRSLSAFNVAVNERESWYGRNKPKESETVSPPAGGRDNDHT